YPQILGRNAALPPFPEDRYAGITSYAQALALFEADARVPVLMENRAGAGPGIPAPTFELGFEQWQPSQPRQTSGLLPSDGSPAPTRESAPGGGGDASRPDPLARGAVSLPQGDPWAPLPPYRWDTLVDGTALAYTTDPLTDDVTIVGPSALDLWLRSSASDTDVQVTLSEVRPDGMEMYVQNGWLRASHRRLDRRRSRLLEPRQTHLESDAAPLPAGFAKLRIGLFAVAHVFRKGSRIRVSVEAPGGDRPSWKFDTPATDGQVVNEIAHSRVHPSRLILPVIPSVVPPSALPPCPSLRGQPCRPYVAAANGG